MSKRAAIVLATWGGCGYAPFASGAVGSAGAAIPAYLAVVGWGVSPMWLALVAAVMTPAAIWSAAAAQRHFGREDPPEVVIDEVVGQWVALAPAAGGVWTDWAAAFVLFRVFDVLKPFGIRRLEKLPGGLGIVADDLAAGLCAMMILAGVHGFS